MVDASHVKTLEYHTMVAPNWTDTPCISALQMLVDVNAAAGLAHTSCTKDTGRSPDILCSRRVCFAAGPAPVTGML